MLQKTAFIGYGDLGTQFRAFVEADAKNKLECLFFDDIAFKAGDKSARPFADHLRSEYKDHNFYIALGYKHLPVKHSLIKNLIREGRTLPSYVHFSSFINNSAKLGAGCFIYPMCNIDKDVELGEGVLLNNSVIISHNNKIGACSYLSPGVVTSGNVQIGENTFIGTGSVISNGIKIGNNVRVGIGSVVNQDLPDGCSAIGSPLRILTSELNLT